MSNLMQYDTRTRFAGTVVSTERLTPPQTDEVRHLQLDIAHDPGFRPGHLVGFLLPGPHAFGQPEHLRLYSVADIAREDSPGVSIGICVRRMSYVDDYSGERYDGPASHYLCDRAPGDELQLCGPFGSPFPIPDDRTSPLVMIGLGTGIAPFRAFVTHIYRSLGGWQGPVRLFHGARTGLDLLYQNDHRRDFAAYYDEETFRAIEAVSPNPHLDEPVDLEGRLREHMDELRGLLLDHRTHVYVAGLQEIDRTLERFLSLELGADKWARRKAELVAGDRWVELLY